MRSLCLLLLGLALPASAAAAETARVVAGERFRAGALHRLLFGADHRELWTTPIELPVLDLASFAGGLTPVRRLGHGQTTALALKGADGVAYTFRAVVKDPVGLLPPELRETFAAEVIRDQMASQHPAGHVVVPPLLDAVGLLHNTPQLVVMPDDPALVEFRGEFKGLVGDIEEYTGQKGWAGALEIIEGEELWKRLDASPELRVDARAYLRARLVDHLIGDWDRHREQWRWARMPGQPLWQPIPEDRDQAFVKFQGLVLELIRGGLPLLVDFGPRYPSLEGLAYDSWDVDRRLLAELDRAAWDEVAADVRGRITDAVIDAAVARMPRPYVERSGAWLAAALKARRDGLPAHAARFYAYLAREVEVRGTDRAEAAELERAADGGMELRLALLGADGRPQEPYFRRRFARGETAELRVYMRGGDDRVAVRGPAGGMRLRVVGGDGSDLVDDSRAGATRVSDADAGDRVLPGGGTRWDRRPYTPPPPPAHGSWMPARDWGRRTLFPVLRVTGSPELGVVGALGLQTTGFGFRKHPFADKQSLRVAYATRHRAFRADYEARFRFENARPFVRIEARASGLEILRFYGFGNETEAAGADRFHKVSQSQYAFAPSLALPLGGGVEASLGPLLKYASTRRPADSFVGRERPYGSDGFGQLGAGARLALDATDAPGLPGRGVAASLEGAWYPALWDATAAFGSVRGEARGYATAPLPLAPTLALGAGGARVWGRYPFHEAAFVGGADSLRGLRAQRYAGDAALYGSAELRLSLGRVFFVVPGQAGLLGVADVGRVYRDGESSRRWHRGVGGGLYFASPQRSNAVSLIVARSEGRTGFYLRAGLGL